MRRRSEAVAAVPAPEAEKKETIAEISGRLRDELSPLPVFKFPTAHAAKEHPIRGDIAQIIETVFLADAVKAFRRLASALRLGEKVTDHASVIRALDNAATNALEAHQLYITAKLEVELWEAKNEVVNASMWTEANVSLQAEKESGVRSKQITDADVRSRCAALHADEWVGQETRRKAAKLAVEHAGVLAELWSRKASALESIAGRRRG